MNANTDAKKTDVGMLHVMPKAYRGGKMPATKPEVPKRLAPPEKKQEALNPSPPKPPPPLMVLAPQKKMAPLKKKQRSKLTLFLAIFGILFIVALAIAGVLLLRSTREPAPTLPVVTVTTPPETPSVTTPVTPLPTPTPTPTPLPFPVVPSPGRDSDSDGLTDVEERLFNSNSRLPDSDADGFLDGNEIFHQYDPMKPAPTTVIDSGLAARVEAGGFSLVVPSAWTTEISEDGAMTVTIPSGEMMVFAASPLRSQTFEQWVAPQETNLEFFTTRSLFRAATNKDQMIAFIDMGRFFLRADYTLDGKSLVEFLQTFQMMINSVEVL